MNVENQNDELTDEMVAEYHSSGGETDLGSTSNVEVEENNEDAVDEVENVESQEPELNAEPADNGAEAEESGEEEPKKKDDRTVPLGALQSERQKRQKLEEDMQRLRADKEARDKVIESRLAQLQAAIPKPAEKEPEPAPTPDTDVMGWAQSIDEKLKQREKIEQQQRDQQQRHQQQRQQAIAREEGIKRQYIPAVQNLAEEDPDFRDAYNGLSGKFFNQYKKQGLTDQQAQQAVLRSEFEFVEGALRRGENPAHAVYELAKDYGFQPKPKEQPVAPAARLETVREGQQRNKTMSGSGSSGGVRGKPNAETLVSMSDDEFLKKVESGDFASLMGG